MTIYGIHRLADIQRTNPITPEATFSQVMGHVITLIAVEYSRRSRSGMTVVR